MRGTEPTSALADRPVASARRPVGPTLWLALGAVVLALALLTPATGDDWRRIDFADRTVSGFVGKSLEHYQDHNGRLAGNIVSYALMEPVWLRALAKAGAVVGLVAVLGRVTGGRTAWHVLLCFAGIFLLPAPVFRQSLGWSTGFFYYVPPMIGLVLLVGTLAGRWPTSHRANTWPAAVTCAALGLLSCLFVEHVTLAVVVLALAGLGLDLAVHRRPTWALVGWAAGALAGTVTMLLSPGLRSAATGGSSYYGSSGEAWAGTVVSNYGIITRAFVFSSPVVMGLLVTACLVHALSRLRRTRAPRDLVLVLAVLLVSGYAVARQLWLYGRLACSEASVQACDLPVLGLDLAMLLLLLAVLVVTGLRAVPGEYRAVWGWLLAATLLMMGPLLLVQPIGARNLYGPLVTVVGMVALTARGLVEGRTAGARLWQAALAVTTVVGLGMLTVIQWSNGEVARARVVLMEEAVADRRGDVVLPAFPYPRWVHGGEDEKIGYRYYLERRQDIEISFSD